MTTVKFVNLILCKLTLYEHLERWPDRLNAVASSYFIFLGTSELVTTPNFYAQAMLALKAYRYITYFEIWALNDKIINTY